MITRGSVVTAPYQSGLTVEVKRGKVVDVLSSQVFVKFDDGTEGFAFLRDKQLKQEK